MRLKSRSDTLIASDSAMTLSASRSADWVTKLVRSVWRSAAARSRRAFTSGFTRMFMRSVSSRAARAMGSIPELLMRRYTPGPMIKSLYVLNAHNARMVA